MSNQPTHTLLQEEAITTDSLQRLPEYIRLHEQLLHLRKTNTRQYFKEISTFLVKLANEGKINRQTAAYAIADSMRYPEIIVNHALEDYALKLALPHRIATAAGTQATYDSAWQEFEAMIQRL
jgi:hypothetical protein